MGENICRCYDGKGLKSKIYKQLIQLNIKKPNNLIIKWAEKSKWTEDLNRYFFQRSYTDGQQTHKKMLNIANYQRIVNSSNNEISPHTSERLCYH